MEVIDLGLSVKWASCNLGALSPEEYGNYYAWGETYSKDRYDDGNYALFGVDSQYGIEGENAKFNPGILTLLRLEDDVANNLLGGNWRMPTMNEFGELFKRCVWERTIFKGSVGFKVTSKIKGYEGSSIFLPTCGLIVGEKKVNDLFAGYYWNSSLYKSNCRYAISSVFDSKILIPILPQIRYLGLSVRAVCEKSIYSCFFRFFSHVLLYSNDIFYLLLALLHYNIMNININTTQ